MLRTSTVLSLIAFGLAFNVTSAFAQDEPLEEILEERSIESLARMARLTGDEKQGAAIFHRPGLACTQCHSLGGEQKSLGPDMTRMGERGTAEHIVESILHPSEKVENDFQTVTVELTDGTSVTGILKADDRTSLQLIVPGEDPLRKIPTDEIEDRYETDSLMPRGLVNQLASEREFFDLVSFLLKISAADEQQLSKLLADDSLIQPPQLPDYEQHIDHAGMIDAWNRESRARGQEVYHGLCMNCHGTEDEPGSLPNALPFATGEFRNGSDPHSIYKTLTHGYRMMLPQHQLVPQQKYDVIHFIREHFLKDENPSQYTKVDPDYLNGLPKGDSRGPQARDESPWEDMDYGPMLIGTYEVVGPDSPPAPHIDNAEIRRAKKEGRPAEEQLSPDTNFAYKGIALRLSAGDATNNPAGSSIARGSHWMVFDHDTMRMAGAWSGDGFINWRGILFNGQHAVAPRTIGDLHFATPDGPGWANPNTGDFEDLRIVGRDGFRYGPLPRDWARYHGLYRHGNQTVISYSIGDARILESPDLETIKRNGEAPVAVWTRTLNIGKSSKDLLMRIAERKNNSVSVVGVDSNSVVSDDRFAMLKIEASKTPVNLKLLISKCDSKLLTDHTSRSGAVESLDLKTKGGPALWNRELATIPAVGENDDPFAVDILSRPESNPWKARLRTTGLDFMPEGNALAVCCWDGDVWIVSGIDQVGEKTSWRRIASGLFQPLGLKVIDGRIHVSCRDQIVILNDLNGDGETDFYECFNSDHQVTHHFHEFAMGLQSDDTGNLYYAKSARHARRELVPHHGTLLKVSSDGQQTTILANGFRAANGVCLNPDGSFFVTDQEGHWTPMNRINRVVPGKFYGNMYSYGAPDDNSDEAMELPICWVDKEFDRSPSELLRVQSDSWGALNGSILNFSYGYGNVYIVLSETVKGTWQGGMSRLPVPEFPTGVMRARFHPTNGHLYVCGMASWATSQTAKKGGLYRIRRTDQPLYAPIGLAVKKGGMQIEFSAPLDREAATDVDNYLVETWSLRRSSDYGSDHYNERELTVGSAAVASDGKTLALQIPDIQPTWGMRIIYRLTGTDGQEVRGSIENTIHQLGD